MCVLPRLFSLCLSTPCLCTCLFHAASPACESSSARLKPCKPLPTVMPAEILMTGSVPAPWLLPLIPAFGGFLEFSVLQTPSTRSRGQEEDEQCQCPGAGRARSIPETSRDLCVSEQRDGGIRGVGVRGAPETPHKPCSR